MSKDNPGEHHNAEKLLPIMERDYKARIAKLEGQVADLTYKEYVGRCVTHDLIVAILEGRETMDHEDAPKKISTSQFMRAIKKAIASARAKASEQ